METCTIAARHYTRYFYVAQSYCERTGCIESSMLYSATNAAEQQLFAPPLFLWGFSCPLSLLSSKPSFFRTTLLTYCLL